MKPDSDSDSDDRISYLPEEIISQILSFLPTKDAVATRVLSRSWMFLWINVINLDFCYHDVTTIAAEKEEDKSRKFIEFVNYVLLLSKPACLNKFSLIWKHKSVPFFVNYWISTAVAKKVHELIVSVSNSDLMIQVPRSMFSCDGLQSLELNCNLCISSEIVFSLPKLESLKLISVYFQHLETFGKLVGGCPLLKYLYIDMNIEKIVAGLRYLDIGDDDDGRLRFAFEYVVSSTTLRHLELYVRGSFGNIFSLLCTAALKLDAPSLEYIILKKISTISILGSLSSLVEANIRDIQPYDEVDDVNIYCNSVVEAISAFDCVKALTLSDDVIWAISIATNNLTTRFNGLTKLEVAIGCCNWSKSLQDLIQLSHRLEVVSIKKVRRCISGEFHRTTSKWKEPNQVPSCLSNSLKTVSLDEYYGGEDEVAMIGYMLNHGSALRVMRICFSKLVTKDTKWKLGYRIYQLPKKSNLCQIRTDAHIFVL